MKKSVAGNLDLEKILAAIFNSGTTPISISDDSGKCIMVNPAFCAFFGYGREELIGRSLTFLVSGSAGDNPSAEVSLQKKDGTWVEGTIQEESLLLTGGQRVKISSFHPRKLEAYEPRNMEALINTTTDLIWSVNRDFRLIAANKAFLNILTTITGLNLGPGDSLQLKDKFPSDILTTWESLYIRAFDGNSFVQEIFTAFSPDFPESWAEVSFNPIYDGNDISGVACYSRDITGKKVTEAAIRNNEEKLRLIMNAALEAIICMDLRGAIISWNRSAEEIFGWKENEVLGKRLSDLIIPVALRSAHEKGMAHYIRTGQGPVLHVVSELTAIRRSAEEFPVELSVMPVRQGDTEFFCGFVRDITERKKAENAIRLSNEIYATAARATNDCLWDWDLVRNKVERPGKRLENAFGYADIGPDKVDEFWREHVHPDDWLRINARRKLIFEDPHENYWGDEYRFMKADGGYAHVSDQGYVIRDKKGRAIRMIGASRDITKEKEAEGVLRASEERYRDLFNNNPACIWIWDLDNLRILEVNDTAVRQYGYGRKELLSMTILGLRFTEDYNEIYEFIEAAKGITGYRSVGTWRHVDRSGNEMYMSIASHLVQYKGKPAIFSLATNVTDKILLERELEHTRRTKQQEITEAVTSAQDIERQELGRELHDNVNQIMFCSRLYLSMAKSEPENKDAHIDKAITLIEEAMSEIRSLSHVLILPSPNDSELLPMIKELIEQTVQASSVQISMDISGFNEDEVDEKLKLTIYRIVQEQFNNIVRHAHAKNVVVGLAKKGTSMVLSIKDDGVGFDTSKESTGVGLINISTRASLINGEVTIVSSPGKGCELNIVFG